jgi:predicted dehydrogenase
MRVGMAGLAGLYWPVCMGNGLIENKDVEFVAAATLGESEEFIRMNLGMSVQEYTDKYRIKLYEHAKDMIEKEKLDCVVLITRHSRHADLVEQIAETGVNVFIPKTFTTTMEDADRIINAEKKYGFRIASGPTARFLPEMVAMKQAIDKGLIGKPFAARICHHHGTIDGFHPMDWYRDPREGGPELSLAWYGIDLILQFMEGTVKSIFSTYGNYTTPDSPFMDCGRIELRMDSGAMASFDMYFCNRVPYPSWQVEILGPKGVISIHRMPGSSHKTVVSLDSIEGYREIPLPEKGPHWEHFWIDDFLHGRTPTVTSEYARLVTQLSLVARESAEKGCAMFL